LLGEHLRGIEFSAAYSGSLARQRATAAEALPGAEILVDPGWDEFDLSHVYQELAPRLIADDEAFRIEYEEMQHAIARQDAAVHRKWNDTHLSPRFAPTATRSGSSLSTPSRI
jgi:hypothetical protein